MNDAAHRLEQQRVNELKRLAERGKDDPDRGKDDPDRGKDDPDRGMFPDSNSQGQVVDIFRRVAGLGGHLVVAFVAPVGASLGKRSARLGGRVPSVVASAQADLAALREQFTSNRTLATQVMLNRKRRLEE
jgi:hypothetical protein